MEARPVVKQNQRARTIEPVFIIFVLLSSNTSGGSRHEGTQLRAAIVSRLLGEVLFEGGSLAGLPEDSYRAVTFTPGPRVWVEGALRLVLLHT
jgi:hypothetical protein